MIHFLLLASRQGKIRLSKWYSPVGTKQKEKDSKEVVSLVLHRGAKLCNVIEWREQKLIYRRYASLFFICAVDATDNELLVLETIHHFVEILDKYFGNVCELDLIFNFQKAHYILDELLMGGEVQETSKRVILRSMQGQDLLMQDVETTKLGI
jgi:AP-1 complex subunit sigma 1/2